MAGGKVLSIALGLVGLWILGGDIYGDFAFFSNPEARRFDLLGTALLRNTLTLAAIVALFMERKLGAYLMILVGLLGVVRRWMFLAPVFSAGHTEDLLILISGMDIPFRILLLGAGLGFLTGRESKK